jgi:site-specific recombinase XerD
VVARRAHNPEVVGSNPTPATNPSADPRLHPTIAALTQLNPRNQDIIMSLTRQLAQGEGLTVALTPSILTHPADGISLWVADMKARCYSARTIETYVQAVSSYLAHDPVPTALSIKQYIATRLETISPARVGTERKALKSLFTHLVEAGLWDYNPVAQVRCIPDKHRERKLPSREDIDKLLHSHTYRRRDECRFKVLATLLLDCGLRITEAASIRKADIDFNQLEIKVLGKGGRERTIPMSRVTAQLLKTYIAQDGSSPRLFPANNKLGYLDIRSYEKSMRRVCRRLGVKITPHQLRHAYASYSLQAGARLEVISKLLGHRSISTTADIYAHWCREDLRREHERYGWFACNRNMLELHNKEA